MLLLKKNTKSLTKLTMAKFAFDFLLRKGEENKNSAILYLIFRLEYFEENPKSDIKDQSERDAKKLATKVTITTYMYLKQTTFFHCVHSN